MPKLRQALVEFEVIGFDDLVCQFRIRMFLFLFLYKAAITTV